MFSFANFRDKIRESLDNSFLSKTQVRRGIIVGITFLLLSLIMTLNFLPNRIELEVGEVSPTNIEAPKTTTFIDQQKTEERKQLAAEAVSKVYEEDVAVLNTVLDEITGFFSAVREVDTARKNPETGQVDPAGDFPATPEEEQQVQEEGQQAPEDGQDEGQAELALEGVELTLEEKVQYVQDRVNFQITAQMVKIALKMELPVLEQVEDFSKELMIKYLKKGIRPAYLDSVKEDIRRDIYASDLSEPQLILANELAQRVIQPNLKLDQEETQKRQEEAREKVEPVKRTVRKGEIIVREGKVVTGEDIQVLEALGLMRPQVNVPILAGMALIVAIFLFVYGLYLHYYHSAILQDQNQLILISLLVVVIMGLAKVLTFFPITNPGYLVPVASVSILLAMLVNNELAIVLNMGIAILVALVTQGGLPVATVNMIGGFVGIFAVAKVNQRSDMVRAGILVGLAISISIFSFGLTNNFLNMIDIFKLTLLGIVNGIFTAVLTNGLLPMLENFFGIISPVKLLELSNPNQPLLKKLLLEAPGTYHHSIIVGNLAEAAADEVGADSLLVRVGAYYHDIGKIKRPYFFSDNQFAGENPHEKLSPNLSTLIIKTHVKDGVELAKSFKLPRPIIDIIQQHQGTSLISFFYEEAKHDEKYKEINEEEFRYEGPKPQTAEAALVMLADIVEAALRSKQFSLNNKHKIEASVRELVYKKLEDGQLDESELTLKDLDKIVNSFVKVLTGIFHKRVEYPEGVEEITKEIKGVSNGGSNPAESAKKNNGRK
ncbi:MAG: HDIG domain-containing metalloprotein [Halanaerobium sp.]|nr:HDIG domain-containing metalloprotein [Halanaerobium sp.]